MYDQEGSVSLQLLISKLLSGDSDQYRIVRNRIAQYVAHQRSLTGMEREDLLSDIMIILLDCLKQGRFRGDSLQALNVFIYNTIRNRLSHIDRRGSNVAEEAAGPENEVDGLRLQDEKVADEQLATRIYAMLDPACRKLLWLRFHMQWNDNEIAEYLGKTKNAVSTAICRCLMKARNFDFIRDLA